MKSSVILGYVRPIIASNVDREACNWRFNNLFHGAWCVIRFMHHVMHPFHIYNFY